MSYLSVDHLIIYAILLITVIIGFRTGRGVKDIREYAIANRMFGTAALVLTWLATDVAGETILDMTSSVRTTGIVQILATFGGWGIAMLVQAFFFAPKFVHFNNCITMGDVMGQLYKGPSQVITGILGFFTAMCIAGMELTVLGLIFEAFLGIDYYWGVAIGGMLLVTYTVYGGIKSVTYTDLFQFLVLLVVLPIITVTALKQAGGIKQIFMQVPTTQFQVFNHPQKAHYLSLFLTLSIFQFTVIDPALIQRMLMGRTKQQLRNQFFIIAASLFGVMLTLLVLGLASIVLYPNDPEISILLHIILNILPIGLKGLAAAGFFAINMATFNSFLHAAGLTLVHDVIMPLYNRTGKTLNELPWTRYITVLIGFIAIAVGLMRKDDLYNFVLVSYRFTGPLLAFPLFAGVWGLKPDRYAFYIASVATLVVFFIAKFFLSEENQYIATLISVIANGIIFLGIHAINNKGFVVIKRTEEKEQEYLWQPWHKYILVSLKQLLPTPQRIVTYSQRQVAKYGASYILLGVFCIINYLVPYFMWDHDTPASYNLMLYLRFIAVIACGLLVVKDKWPSMLLPYLPTFWHLTLLYCIPFMGTVMFILAQGSIEWLINVALSITLLIVLVDWASFIILSLLGVALGLLFYGQVIGPIHINLNFSTAYLLIYQGIFATLIGLLFARRKQQSFDQLATEHQSLKATDQENREALLETFKEKVRLLKTLKRAGIRELSQVVKLVRELRTQGKEVFKESQLLNKIVQQLEDTITPMAVTLEKVENRATAYLRLEVKAITIKQLIEQIKEQLPKQNLRFLLHTHHQEIVCDPTLIRKTLVNTLNCLKPATDEHQIIWIGLQDTTLAYPLHSFKQPYVKTVSAIGFTITTQPTVPPIEKTYEAQMDGRGSCLPMPETPQDFLLATNQRIIKAHYGYTNIDLAKTSMDDTYRYIIPVQLSEVRPPDMNDPYMELGADLVRADDTYPGAREQEEAFLAAVQQRTKANLDAVKTALEMIKWYHGPKKRLSGEPYYLHPLAVAQIVLDYNQDEATIVGALLHDTVEDTPMLLENIEMMFGPDVVGIVDGVTHFECLKESFYKVKLSTHENMVTLLEVEDKRVLYVKIADRMHNMRTIEGHRSYAKKRQIAEETLQFFAPLAKALGLEEVVKELKERSLEVLNQAGLD